MKLPKNLGTILLAIWLILHGAFALLNLSFAHSGEVMAVLAIVAGVLIFLQR